MGHQYVKLKPSRVPRRYGWHETWPVWAIAGFFILLMAVSLIYEYRVDRPPKSDVAIRALRPAQDLQLNTGTLKPMQLHLFEANVSGKKVLFVVEKISDSVIHVSLTTCRVCYRLKRRSYARKGQMICGECNRPMPFETTNRIASTNSCALPEIPHKTIGSDLFVLGRDVIGKAKGLQQ